MNSMIFSRLLIVFSIIGSFFSISLMFPEFYEEWIFSPFIRQISQLPSSKEPRSQVPLTTVLPKSNVPPATATATATATAARSLRQQFGDDDNLGEQSISDLLHHVDDAISQLHKKNQDASIKILSNLKSEIGEIKNYINSLQEKIRNNEDEESIRSVLNEFIKKQDSYLSRIDYNEKIKKAP